MTAQRGKLGYRIAGNPFHILGLAPDCSRAEIEREGQKLLGMLELGLSAARTYETPLGIFERTPESVREAMAELRDPDRRLGHELWARSRPGGLASPGPSARGSSPESGERESGRGNAGAAGADGAAGKAGESRAADPGASADGAWPEAFALLGWRRS